MSANVAVTTCARGRAGVVVRTATELYVYWQPTAPHPLTVRVTDLSGCPAEALLDGCGCRDREAAAGAGGLYLAHLIPGHLYHVEVGPRESGRLVPWFRLGPVQTPGRPSPDQPRFPAPYHRS